jgi:hypothetical protein
MNLTTNDENGQPWNFDDAHQRQRARERLRADKPLILIGSPMCTAFSCLQSINYAKMHPDRVRAILTRARMHLNFVCSLYEEQVQGGRYFIHEHPATATSWEEPAVKRVMNLPEVRVSRADACQYGIEGIYRGESMPVKKPTKWLSNMRGVNEALSKTCTGQGGLCSNGKSHASCTGSRAEQAAIYPLKLCRAILTGIRNHITSIGQMQNDVVGVMMGDEEAVMDEICAVDGTKQRSMQQRQQNAGRTYDALT